MTDRRRARPRTLDRAGTADHDGAVEVRFSGEPADITALLDTLAAAGIELSGTGRPNPNGHGTGVRLYTRARAQMRQGPTATQPTPPSSAPGAETGREVDA